MRLSYFILLYTTCQDKILFYCIMNKSFGKIKQVGDIMRPLKEKISITLDCDLLDILRKQAENDDRSLSQYINIILKKHINKKD